MSAIIPFPRFGWLRLVSYLLVSWLCLGGASSGQTPPGPPAPPAPPRPRAPAASTMVFVHVRNPEGRPLAGVRVVVSGAISREQTTDFEGLIRLASLADGAYHLRFEREGFVALDQDLTLRRGQPDVVDVTLRTAPPPAPPAPAPPPPPPSPAATPPPPVPPPTPAVSALPSDGEQKIVSVPDFVSRNFIGKETLKESTLGCTRATTTRLLQVRTTIASHAHADVDEVLYVVAGEGALIMSERGAQSIGPGSLGILPRGSAHTIERRGKNPLILLSTLAGSPCTADTAPK